MWLTSLAQPRRSTPRLRSRGEQFRHMLARAIDESEKKSFGRQWRFGGDVVTQTAQMGFDCMQTCSKRVAPHAQAPPQVRCDFEADGNFEGHCLFGVKGDD